MNFIIAFLSLNFVLLFNLLGIKDAKEIEKVKVDTDYIKVDTVYDSLSGYRGFPMILAILLFSFRFIVIFPDTRILLWELLNYLILI